MRRTPAEQLRHEIERLEAEFALLSAGTRDATDAERRLSQIGMALDLLRADAERLRRNSGPIASS